MVGKTVLHYDILEKLGEGGMGIVYKARDTKLSRDVALKFLPSHLASSEPERVRLFQEARAAAALNHSNVAHIYAIEEVDGQKFIVMEYVEGEELKQRISQGPLPVDEATRITLQVCDGLQAAHDRGIIHRDVKSANIMLTASGQVKIMDFGLAKMRGGAQVTKIGSTVGTAVCMSPEQARGEEVDRRTDIWSTGVVLYEMLVGRLPFSSDYEQAVIYSILNESPQPLTTVRPEVPQTYANVVMRALEKDPEHRYSSAREMGDAIRSIGDEPRRRATHEVDQKAKRTGASIAKIAIPVLFVAAVTAWFLLRGNADTVDSLAVLPFENTGGDQDMEYLSDGITESLINSLSQLPQLKVMSRSAVFRFKGHATDPASLGKQLGVRAVLLGRVLQRNDRLSVSAELIDVADNSHLWGGQFNRSSADILLVQEEITREISGELRSRLADKEAERVARRPTESTEAYQAYLKGRYHWNKRSVEGLRRSIEYFQQAVDQDPNFALAYSGMADAYSVLGWFEYGVMSPRDVFPKALAAVRRALEIDPERAESYASLAFIHLVYDLDMNSAEENFKRAFALNPSYATAHQWYAELLMMEGKVDESVQEMHSALSLDPLSLIITRDVGWMLYFARRYKEADEYFRKALDLDPDFMRGHLILGQSYLHQGLLDEAMKQFETAAAFSQGPVGTVMMAYCHARAGRTREARGILQNLLALSRNSYIPPGGIALIYDALGDRDRAFEWLKRAKDEHSGVLLFNRVDPFFDGLRSDPRFSELLQGVRTSVLTP